MKGLVPKKETFFTVMQGDGNLCTYQGSGPNDNHGGWWCHMQYGPTGPYFTVLRDDGILCTYKGPNPQTIWSTQWCSVAPSAAKVLPPGVIDINQPVVDWINRDPGRSWRTLNQAIGVPGTPEGWYIESLKITQLKNTLVDMKMPASTWWPVKSKEVVLCAPTDGNTAVTIGDEVANSVELSKSNTFDASISATVSYSGLFVGGSVTATAGYSMTNASSQTDEKKLIVSETTMVSFPQAPAGRIAVLWAQRTQGKNVPWSASFTPTDDQVIEITARRLGRDDRFTGRLPWIQMKTYLPEARRTFTVNGTFDVNKVDPGSTRVILYPMVPEDVAMLCSDPPAVQRQEGYADKAQASASVRPRLGGDVAVSARPTAAGRRGGIIERDLSAAEMLQKTRGAAPPVR